MSRILMDGALLSLISSIYLSGILRFNQRLFLQNYPEAIQQLVPPKTDLEKRQSLLLGVPSK